jgi:hypothetical protein
MISGVRDCVLSLACRRHNLPATQGRGIDRLPAEIRKPLEAALVGVLEGNELRRALRVVVEALLREVREIDMALASRIEGALQELSN